MNRTHRWTAAPALALLGALLLGAPAVAAPVTDTGTGTSRAQGLRAADAPKLSRAEEIRRAKVWLTANNGKPVPYSQKETWSDGYRQDCSGYASMALRLPKSGPNTVALKNDGWTKAIKMSELRQGDLVIKANSSDPDHRHVVIFDSWDNGKHTSYHAYEQAGGVGTRHASHTYGLKDGDNYHAYRPVNLTD
ncbi:hypothetical protein ACI1MP_36725 [Kitasatospora griseola]|uniref:hypothetical protein n=1 Tax=Kitasatospora griseola TaxID=2064 RepID=UPI003855A67F